MHVALYHTTVADCRRTRHRDNLEPQESLHSTLRTMEAETVIPQKERTSVSSLPRVRTINDSDLEDDEVYNLQVRCIPCLSVGFGSCLNLGLFCEHKRESRQQSACSICPRTRAAFTQTPRCSITHEICGCLRARKSTLCLFTSSQSL